MACRAHLVEVQNHLSEIESLGGRVIVVAFAPVSKAAAFLAKYPQPFTVLVDESGAAYRQFELSKTTWMSFFRPSVLARYIAAMFRGTKLIRPLPGSDLLQLGGDFVLDRQGRVVLSHPSTDPTDRPTPEELLAAVLRAAGP